MMLFHRLSLRTLLTLCVFAIAACGTPPENDQAGQEERAIRATAVKVNRETVTLWDEYIGRFEAVERVEIRPRVSGYLDQVHFRDGETVEAGQLLFTIDDREFRAAYAQLNADVKSAQTQVDLTSVGLQRSANLLEERAGSQEEYDEALAANRAAKASLEAAQANLRRASLDLEFTRVKSPISGRVSDARLERGNFVAAGETPLTIVVSIDPIHFSFTGSEQRFLKYLELDRKGVRGSSINTANPVRIQIGNQDGFPITGEMSFIDNAIDPTTSTIRATATVPNPDGFLTPGLFGRLQLFEQETEVMFIPETSIQFDQSRRFVWVVDEQSRAQQKTVEVGRDLGEGRRQIISGLTGDEQIIVGNLFMIRPGSLVTPVLDGVTSSDAESQTR